MSKEFERVVEMLEKMKEEDENTALLKRLPKKTNSIPWYLDPNSRRDDAFSITSIPFKPPNEILGKPQYVVIEDPEDPEKDKAKRRKILIDTLSLKNYTSLIEQKVAVAGKPAAELIKHTESKPRWKEILGL